MRKFVHDPLMEDFEPTLMVEKSETNKGIRLCKETLRKTLIAKATWTQRSKRISSRTMNAPEDHILESWCRSTALTLPGRKKGGPKRFC